MSIWREEVEHTMHPTVLYILPIEPILSLEVLVKLLIYVLFHGANAVTHHQQPDAGVSPEIASAIEIGVRLSRKCIFDRE